MAGGLFDDLIPEQRSKKGSIGEVSFADLIPAPVATPQSGPIEATADIGRLMLRGAAMGKEATPEDAADRANALRQSMGRKFARGRMPEQPAATPEQYRPFFQEQQQEMAAAKQRAGLAGDVAEFGGLMVGGGKIGAALETLGNAARAAPVAGKLLASPWTTAGATGAVLGASQAQGTDQNKIVAALLGSGAGIAGQAAGNALAGGVAKAAGLVNAKPSIPTREGIEAAKKAAYQEAENAGVVYTPQFAARVRAEIEPQLAKMGYDPALQPKIAPVIARLEKAAEDNVTLPGVEVLRKVAANAYEPGNKASNSMMAKIINALDDASANPRAGDVLMGDAATGTKALLEARKNAQIGFKMDTVQGQLEKALNQANRTYSGTNLDNAIRQKLSSLLDNPSRTRGFTQDELAALRQAVEGTSAQNAARWAGKVMPSSGIGAIMSGGAGYALGGPLGLAVPAAGYGLRKTAEGMSKGNVDRLVNIIAAGGKKADTLPKENALQRLARSERDRIARALMMGGIVAGAPLAQ